ncbi:MAG: PKD domain-containing protein [Planctomycetes bacterium]|nr:PKD domain-containing protein [Planctomycetota bacterium]
MVIQSFGSAPRRRLAVLLLACAAAIALSGCDEPSARGVRGGAVGPAASEVIIVANGLGESFSVLPLGEGIRNDWGRTGAAPNAIVLRGAEGFLVNSLSNAIQVFDPATMATRREVSVGSGANPMEIAFLSDDPADLRAYVSLFVAGAIDLIDLSSAPAGPRRIARIDLDAIDLARDAPGFRTRPFPGGIARSGRRIFATLANLTDARGGLTAGGPGVLAVIDADPDSPRFNEGLGTVILAGRDPVTIRAFEEDPDLLFVASAGSYDGRPGAGGFAGDGLVEIVDASTLEVLGSIATGGAPLEVAFATDGTGYIADGMCPAIDVFDARAAAARARSAVSPPEDLSDLVRDRILVRAAPSGFVSGLAVASDGRLFALDFEADRLVEIAPDGAIVARHATGDGPDAIAIARSGTPVEPGRIRIAGSVWYGQMAGTTITAAPAFPPDASPIATAQADGDGRFAMSIDRIDGAILLEVDGGAPRAFIPELPQEGSVEVAITPWTEIASALAIARADLRASGIRAASERIRLYLGDPDPEVERTLAAGLETLAGDLGPASAIDLAAALGRDAGDGRFDGLERGRAIAIGGGAGLDLPADAGSAGLAAATRRVAGGAPIPAGILEHLAAARGWIPPAGRAIDLVPPHAAPIADLAVRAGEELIVDGSASGDDRGIALFAWDFDTDAGEGVDAMGATAAHVYREPGRYAARLIVFDAFGNNDAADFFVDVAPADGEPVATEPSMPWTYGPYDDEVYVRARGSAPRIDVFAIGLGPPLRTIDLGGALDDPAGIALRARAHGYVLGTLAGGTTSAVAAIDPQTGEVRGVVDLGEPGFLALAAGAEAVFAASESAVVIIDGEIDGENLRLDAARFEPGVPISRIWVDAAGLVHVLGRDGGDGLSWILEPIDLSPVEAPGRGADPQGVDPAQQVAYADRVIAYAPRGTPGTFTDPALALGPPRGRGQAQGALHVVSLGDRDAASGPAAEGFGGSLALGFAGKRIIDAPGPDLRIFENAQLVAGDRRVRWIEACVVQVSQDGESWRTFPVSVDERYRNDDPRRFAGVAGLSPCFLNPDPLDPFFRLVDAREPAAGGDAFDLADVRLAWARYVRIIDGGTMVEDGGNDPFLAQRGADIDAVAALWWADDPGAPQ